MRNVLLGLVLSLFSIVAYAGDHGTWYCQECYTQQDFPAPNASPEATGFVTTTVNGSPNNGTWQQGDTVTLCDGSTCYTYIFRSTVWSYTGLSTNDPNRYKNQNDWGPREGGTPAIYPKSGILSGNNFTFITGSEVWVITCTVGGLPCGA